MCKTSMCAPKAPKEEKPKSSDSDTEEECDPSLRRAALDFLVLTRRLELVPGEFRKRHRYSIPMRRQLTLVLTRRLKPNTGRPLVRENDPSPQ